MNETERQAIRTTMAMLLAKRQEIDSTLKTLSVHLGEPIPELDGAGAVPETPSGSDFKGDPETWINTGQFFGHNATQAAKKVLEMSGPNRPLKTEALFRAFQHSGIRSLEFT